MNWFKLLHMPQSSFTENRHKIYTRFPFDIDYRQNIFSILPSHSCKSSIFLPQTYKASFMLTYIITFYVHKVSIIKLEFRESDMSPGQTEIKQAKFVEFISRTKDYFRETYKSQNINPISPTPKFTFGIIQIKVISLSTSF